jgi:hypothetical protein
VALGAIAERLDNRRQDIVPLLHLDCEDSQAYTQLDSDRLGSWGEMLEKQEDLVSKGGQFASRDLRREVVCDLIGVRNVGIWQMSQASNLSTQCNGCK